MSKNYCYKSKQGTEFDKAIKNHFKQLSKWKSVFNQVGELLGETITRMGTDKNELYVDLNQIKNETNKKLFTKDGKLKGNSKAAKLVREEYLKILKEEGLDDYQELGLIHFSYGVMRMNGQSLERFRTSEDDIYYKADFDLADKVGDILEEITEVEYQEKYLEELKNKDN
jgi:arabinogalactan endo-1,4-beta-galactosidase